jgi:hypothetical protein
MLPTLRRQPPPRSALPSAAPVLAACPPCWAWDGGQFGGRARLGGRRRGHRRRRGRDRRGRRCRRGGRGARGRSRLGGRLHRGGCGACSRHRDPRRRRHRGHRRRRQRREPHRVRLRRRPLGRRLADQALQPGYVDRVEQRLARGALRPADLDDDVDDAEPGAQEPGRHRGGRRDVRRCGDPGVGRGNGRGETVLAGIAVQIREPRGYGRCRIAPLADASAASPHAFVRDRARASAR